MFMIMKSTMTTLMMVMKMLREVDADDEGDEKAQCLCIHQNLDSRGGEGGEGSYRRETKDSLR